MKKLICLCLLMVLCAVPVQAKTGDIAGTYYATDIVTTLNGFPIEAINIGGNTLIDAEAMAYYGFSVTWLPETRCLDITSFGEPHEMRPAAKGNARPVGAALGRYYETDIITSLDGEPITAYNIGGRTFLHAEPLLQKLDSMKSFDVTGYECNPVEKYDLIGQSIILTINGEQAENIRISRSQGNGHVDFELTFGNIPPCTHSELRELHFSLV